MENPNLGIVGFAFYDFKFLSVQALLIVGWHFTSSMIHALTLFLTIHHTITTHDQSCSTPHCHTSLKCGMHVARKLIAHVLKFTSIRPIKML